MTSARRQSNQRASQTRVRRVASVARRGVIERSRYKEDASRGLECPRIV
jgi:hypothetical protein